jgi:hypothetical protein
MTAAHRRNNYVSEGTVLSANEFPIAVGVHGNSIKGKTMSILELDFIDGSKGKRTHFADRGETHPQVGDKIRFIEVKLRPALYTERLYDNPFMYSWATKKLN